MKEPISRLPTASLPPLRDGRTIAFLALLLIVTAVRFVNLSADPPLKLTTSQGVYTDPAAYTLSARNYALFGDANPLHDERFPLFENSAVSYLARPVFGLFGVGYAQANTVGLLFSLGAIFLIAGLLRRFVSTEAALFALVLLLFNQNQYHYGRLPFLENAMVFLGVLSFFLLVTFEHHRWGAALSGFILPTAFLYGKSHGIVFAGVVGAFFIWRVLSINQKENGDRRAYLGRVVAPFALGAMIQTGLWYVWIGSEALPTIGAYLAEQSTGLYGAPEAFDSTLNFFWKLFSLGVVTKVFSRMPIASLGAFVMICLFVWRMITGRRSIKDAIPGGAVSLLFLFWFVMTYLELFPWNYRPLRYQIPLTYSACALGGIWLGYIWRASERVGEDIAGAKPLSFWKRAVLFAILAVLFVFPVYQLLSRKIINTQGVFHFSDHIYWVFGGGAAAGVLFFVGWILLRRFAEQVFRPVLVRGLVVALPAITLGIGLAWFNSWLTRPLYTIVATSKDLQKTVGPTAVISGPYGVGLSFENRLRAVVHMFGVADPDTSFFERFPVTHLLLDESNRTRFEQMHPEIAFRAKTIHTYRITNRKVELVRVAGVTGNTEADRYELSDFEKVQLVFEGELEDPNGEIVKRLMYSDKVNLAINLYMSARAEKMGNLADAAFFVEAALEASPSDFNLWAELGRVYTELFKQSRSGEFREKALSAFTRAHALNPASADKTAEYEKELEKSDVK